MQLNRRALELCDQLERQAAELRASVTLTSGVSRIIDCGVESPGGLAAGLLMARICVAGLAEVSLVPSRSDVWHGPSVQVHTDQPLAACMASQYAGWQLAEGKYFAMGSGPMRAAAHQEKLIEETGFSEVAEHVVGVLEASKLPPEAICAKIAAACGVSVDHVTLVVARTASIAGTLQVVARTVETALHKMHTLGFELSRVESGYGLAPLPPIARDDVTAIGWTNDAVLYGGQVTLWVRGDDDSLAQLGARVPSAESSDYGEPFAAIFDRYGRDFYKIDPLLFSPALVTFINLDTGRVHTFGEVNAAVLKRSFASAQPAG